MNRSIEGYNRAATGVATRSNTDSVLEDDEGRLESSEGRISISAMSTLANAEQRGFTELRGVIMELVEEGAALGLTAAELFLQLDSCASPEGISGRDLRKGLASLSVHLTEREVETVMVGAGCTGGKNQHTTASGPLLTLDRFLAMVRRPLSRRPTILPIKSKSGTPGGASDAGANVGAGAEVGVVAPVADKHQALPHAESGRIQRSNCVGTVCAVEDADGCAMPDGLEQRMSLSELLVDNWGDGNGGDGPCTSSSAAAHVEAFGRVAADVKAVLTTAISRSDAGYTGGGERSNGSDNGRKGGRTSSPADNSDRRTRPSSGGRNCPVAASSIQSSVSMLGASANASAVRRGRDEGEGKSTGGDGGDYQHYEEKGETLAKITTSAAASRSGPVQPTGSITPPFGSARSTSEPLHPTRASLERLKAALEDLDLKERLRSVTNGEDYVPGTSIVRGRASERSAEACRSMESSGNEGKGPPRQSAASSVGSQGRLSPRTVTEVAKPDSHAACSFQRMGLVDVDDGACDGASSEKRTSAARKQLVVGAGERGERFRRFSDRRVADGGGSERRRRLAGVVELVSVEGNEHNTYDDATDDAPEIIGRLRARVAELELSEQLLRCELEGTRADVVSKSRRAEEELQREKDRAKGRERAIQARLSIRLRAAEAEAAVAEKRMAAFKITSAAEAAAREKSSADYLRRRLKEAEAALETKAARRASLLSKKERQRQQRRPTLTNKRQHGWRRESSVGENAIESPTEGAGRVSDRGAGNYWGLSKRRARQPPRRSALQGEVGGLGAGGDEVSILHEELKSCREKLVVVTAEALRLRTEATASVKDTEKRDTRQQDHGAVGTNESRRRKPARPKNACRFCEERSRSSLQRRRERERRIEARMAESEDARIEVEAEASRLQAFLDEMRGLGSPYTQTWCGNHGELAAE